MNMHLWMKGIQVCLNEGPFPFPKGDNSEIAKIHTRHLKIFSRAGLISVKRVQSPSQREIIDRNF